MNNKLYLVTETTTWKDGSIDKADWISDCPVNINNETYKLTSEEVDPQTIPLDELMDAVFSEFHHKEIDSFQTIMNVAVEEFGEDGAKRFLIRLIDKQGLCVI